MKKNRLRGLLLGVSMALLLSGGVSLAASVDVKSDQPCFVCASRNEYPIPEDKVLELTFSGYDPGEDLYYALTVAGSLGDEGYIMSPLTGPPCRVRLSVRCEDLHVTATTDCEADLGGTGFPAQIGPSAVPELHGEWIWRIEQNGDADEVSFLFAEVCEVEFVPEPGSILLLGSGLAGLAGYATLRWRTRE